MSIDPLQIWLLCSSFVLTIGLFSQGFKIWKSKSVENISAGLVYALMFSEPAWFLYGLRLKAWPIIVICGFNLIATFIIVGGYLKYRSNNAHS